MNRRKLAQRRLHTEPLESRCLLASLAGHVFNDVDTSGLLDGNDVGLAGVTVELTDEDGEVRTTTTDAAGGFLFDGLPKSTYSVSAQRFANMFDGDVTIGSGKGKVSGTTITGIKLNGNKRVEGYDFAKLEPASLSGYSYVDLDRDGNYDDGDTPLDNSFLVLRGVDDLDNRIWRVGLTDSNGRYDFSNLRPGTYDIFTRTPFGYVDGRDQLGSIGGNPLPVANRGVLQNDHVSGIELFAGQEGRNYNFGEFDAHATQGILATTFDQTVVVKGSSADDNFEFIAGETNHQVWRNGQVVQTIDASVNTRIEIIAYGGANTVQLVGGSGVDQVELRERSAKLTGVSYQVLVYSSTQTTVQSGGGQDRALFYDTAGDETFRADPLSAQLVGDGFEHTANDFHRVYAYATAGNDQAFLTGSDGNDRFKASPTNASLYGAGFYNSASGFDVTHGEALGGVDDRAYLYDSAGDDKFYASGNESRLAGNGFTNYSHGFDRVYATASGGTDNAIFVDTSGADYYKVDGNGARMYGSGYYNRAIGFEAHDAYFSAIDGRNDKVLLVDSMEDDSIEASGNQLDFIRNGVVHRIVDADYIEARASQGSNRVKTGNRLTFSLSLEGDWD